MKGNNPLFKSSGAIESGSGIKNIITTKTESSPPNNTQTKEMSKTGKELLSQAKEEDTQKLIKELYKPGSVEGDGGTADAVRIELKTGKKVGNKSHVQKAVERITQIKNILTRNPNHPDKELLNKLLKDLEDALNGGKK